MILDANEWVHLWSVIASNKVSVTDNIDSLWIKLENSLNWEKNLRLVLDDDKLHCESKESMHWSTIKK